jgi:hypothetical protein
MSEPQSDEVLLAEIARLKSANARPKIQLFGKKEMRFVIISMGSSIAALPASIIVGTGVTIMVNAEGGEITSVVMWLFLAIILTTWRLSDEV